jgi:hypothetical protein
VLREPARLIFKARLLSAATQVVHLRRFHLMRILVCKKHQRKALAATKRICFVGIYIQSGIYISAFCSFKILDRGSKKRTTTFPNSTALFAGSVISIKAADLIEKLITWSCVFFVHGAIDAVHKLEHISVSDHSICRLLHTRRPLFVNSADIHFGERICMTLFGRNDKFLRALGV